MRETSRCQFDTSFVRQPEGMRRKWTQILGLLLCLLGWGFVGCTLAMERWRVSRLGGQGGSSVVETAWYWSDLWKDCYEDSAALVNCVDLGVLWRVKPHIWAVRGLLAAGLCLGLVATVLTFVGLECTYIGGGRRSKDSMLLSASVVHLLGCLSDLTAYCLYINRVAAAFLHRTADPSKLRYEMGPPLYLGLVGSFLIFLGCATHCATACRVLRAERHDTPPSVGGKGERKGVLRGQKHRHIVAYKMSSVVAV